MDKRGRIEASLAMKIIIKPAALVLCSVVILTCKLNAYLPTLSDPNALPVAQNVYGYHGSPKSHPISIIGSSLSADVTARAKKALS